MASAERLAYLRPDDQPIDCCEDLYLTPCGERPFARIWGEVHPMLATLPDKR